MVRVAQQTLRKRDFESELLDRLLNGAQAAAPAQGEEFLLGRWQEDVWEGPVESAQSFQANGLASQTCWDDCIVQLCPP